jgi:hypothetical protein
MELFDRTVFLYLADGRVYVQHGGDIHEADASERGRALSVLRGESGVALDPFLGLEVLPPADS